MNQIEFWQEIIINLDEYLKILEKLGSTKRHWLNNSAEAMNEYEHIVGDYKNLLCRMDSFQKYLYNVTDS